MPRKSKKSKLEEWFAHKIYAIKESKDAHYLADESLCELLIALGYIKVVENYRWVKKDYLTK